MTNKSIEAFQKKLLRDRFSLVYMGEFDDNMTSALMRSNEMSIQENKGFRKKLSYMVVECFQNIIRHADKPELLTQTTNKPKIFILRNIGNVHYISSTNLVENEKRENLQIKLRTINVLSAEDLREVYIGAMINNEISEKGGGGLGLIEMARKSGAPLEYAFDVINYFFSIFYFQVCFRPKEESGEFKPISPSEKVGIDETKDLYNLMLSENVQLIRKGDFSQASILPLIELMETSMNSQTGLPGKGKKTLYLIVELLQNISRHGAVVDGERKGIFMISRKKDKYVLTSGNYVDAADVAKLRTKLDSVVQLDAAALTWAYKNALKKDNPDEKGAGIGLIEMCKYSTEPVTYSLTPESENLSFFSISLSI
ncbi:MAG: SiaB family protein kinase [Bacteroidia bacterium]